MGYVPDLRAPPNRPEIPLLSSHRSYPRLRAVCPHVGIRVNSVFRSENISARRAQKLGKVGRNPCMVTHCIFKLKIHSSGFRRPTVAHGMHGSPMAAELASAVVCEGWRAWSVALELASLTSCAGHGADRCERTVVAPFDYN